MDIRDITFDSGRSYMNPGKASKKMSLVDENGNFTALSDGAAKRILEIAKKDAEQGVYMGEEFVSYKIKIRDENVSPNRADLIARLTPVVQDAKYTDGQEHYFSLIDEVTEKIQSGKSKNTGSGKIHVGAHGFVTMSFYDNHGEEILAYNSFGGGGFISLPTKAEQQYDKTTTVIYAEAYREARAKINGRASCEDFSGGAAKGFEVQA